MEKVIKLKKEIEKKRRNWNERSNFTLRGQRNLSVADLDAIEFYVDHYLRDGHIMGFIEPQGAIKEVLDSAGVQTRYKTY